MYVIIVSFIIFYDKWCIFWFLFRKKVDLVCLENALRVECKRVLLYTTVVGTILLSPFNMLLTGYYM